MTLEEMEQDQRNHFGNKKHIVCDPCQTSLHVSSYCKMTVHNPRFCPTPEDCACSCHGTAPDLTKLVKAQEQESKDKKGFGLGHRSDVCWSDRHTPAECFYSWCDCWCHKGERQSDRLTRSMQHTGKNMAVEVGSQIAHKILLVDENGQNPRPVLILPSGEIMEIQ